MTRTRAKGDPFWATAITRMEAGPARIVRGLYALVQRSPALKPYLWFGSGWRTGSAEHGSGRAIDIIITENTNRRPTAAERAAAMQLVRFLIANAKALKIQWILFSTDGKPRTQSWSAARGSWKNLADRGSIAANHVDHIHVYFKAGADWPRALNNAIIGAATTPPVKPGPPSTGVSTLPTPASVATLRPGSRGERVKRLQQGLNKRFPAYRHQVQPKGRLLSTDGVYGAHTERWVREFQARSNLAVDGIVGPATLRALNKYGIRP
ncbi:MAG: peptidoglycan-binding domain-containing protein [Propionibacteriaceae bacterium]|nr:peptidoglycan-binding domain-containing protein [Propionibacteriaceae bacterium]